VYKGIVRACALTISNDRFAHGDHVAMNVVLANTSRAFITRRRMPPRCSRITQASPIAQKRVPRTLFSAIVTTMFTDGVGRVVSVRDPLGNLTFTEYDHLNRVTKVTDAINGNVTFTYDAMGNLLTHADQKGNITTYTYNVMNKLATKKDALNNTDTYAYDTASALNRMTDRKSQVSGMTYDAQGRRTQVGFGATTAAPTTYANTLNFTFDNANRMTQVVDNSSGSNQTITRNYDGLDRLTSEVTPQGTVSYAYDAAGRRASMTVPSHGTIAYTYDAANRLTLMTHTPAAPAVGSAQSVAFVYDTANRRTKVTLPNTVEINYAYDNASQLSSITYKKGATTLGDLTYTYDLAGRRAVIGGSYARTNLPTAIPAANAAYNVNNQQTAWGTAAATSHTYDLNGNLTSDGTYTYLWNARNQLREVKQGATTVALYEYDAFGRRKQKSINGAITKFLYDGNNFVQEQNNAGSPTANLIIGTGFDELYARIKTPTTTPATSSFLMDHLGTIIAESDAAGTIPTSYTYEPYGKTTQTGTASDNSQRYTGREQDFGDLYYYRARYYSANESRFGAEDPIGIEGGINLYAFVGADPISKADPDGLRATCKDPKKCDDPGKKDVCALVCSDQAACQECCHRYARNNGKGAFADGAIFITCTRLCVKHFGPPPK
jgi:RHS repeat-associated protein